MMRPLLSLWLLTGISYAPAIAQAPTLVRDFYPGNVNAYTLHGNPTGFREHNGKLLVFANDNMVQVKLWALDGIGGDFEELASVGRPAGYTTTNGGVITSGDNIYFFAQAAGSTDHLLWCVRPGEEPEQLMTLPYSILFGYVGMPLPGGRLVFPGHDTEHGYEPWITDGTVSGTQLLKDINPGTATSFGSPFPVMQGFDHQGKAYFMANDGAQGPQLWTTDGTVGGTEQFATIHPTDATGLLTMLWSRNEDRFVVSGSTGLVASDGTGAGTAVIHAGAHVMAHIPGLNYHTADNGYMYFSALESGDWKLYRTLGTEESTTLVLEDVVPNLGFEYVTELHGMLYALANDGDQNTILVRIDPATRTHSVVRTFTSTQGTNSTSYFYGFRNDGERFYFMGRDGASARQYWQSDGTSAGTRMIHEFMPTALNGGPDAANGNMVVYQGRFLFAANDETVGNELWMAEGTVGLADRATASAEVRVWSDGPGVLNVHAMEGTLTEVRVFDAAGRELAMASGLRTESLAMAVDAPGFLLVDVRTTSGRSTSRVVMP